MTTTISAVEQRATGAAHLRLCELSKTYPGQQAPAVDGVDLDLARGKLLALLGPSGCGKTTTLRMIAGLIDPTQGSIEVDGVDLTHKPVHKRGMGMVFQSYALFPHLDVTRNVAFGLEMRKVDRSERRRRVHEALEMVQLSHLSKRRVRELSGGQQQRIALARALVIEPSVLLLDEPLSNLDAKLREAMRAEIRSIVQRVGVTTVFVTHDQDEALSMADEIAVMSDGRVEQVGEPERIYEEPASRFVADFIGRANLLPGRVVSVDATTALVDVAGVGTMPTARGDHALTAGDKVTVLVRPHRVDVTGSGAVPPGDRALDGRVASHSYTGEMLAYSVQVGEHLIAAETLTGFGASLPVGSAVQVSWRPDDARLIPQA